MEPRIELLATKKLVGKSIIMSLSDNRTGELWRSFMPYRNEIKNRTTTDLISMQVYDENLDFKDFNMDSLHQKWALAEVSDFDEIPDDMVTYILQGGLYAVFIYKGTPDAFDQMFSYIFHSWLPSSEYELDKREHFEILGDKYKNNDPDSEEEVWIPVKKKVETILLIYRKFLTFLHVSELFIKRKKTIRVL